MNEQELTRWRLIEEVLDKRLTQKEAAISLCISERQLRNLLVSYRKAGKQGLISKNRGRTSNNIYDKQFKEKILQILAEKYPGYGPTLSTEKLNENHNILISRETLRNWMIERGMWFEKHSKKKTHQRRDRRACFGELIQGDGSFHIWLEISGIKCCLLVFIDDATSKITSMYLAEEETLDAYLITLKKHIQRYGSFKSLYLDRSAVAKVRKGDNITQFENVLEKLGIELIFAYSPQAKGRVERVNRTLQDRFIKYLKEKKIDTIKEANQVINDFIEDYNKKFGVSPRSLVDLHTPLDKTFDIDLELRRTAKRKLTKDLCFSFNNIVYKVKNKLGSLTESREIEIILLDNDEIRARYNKQWLEIQKDTEAFRTSRDKKIFEQNKKWVQEKDLKKNNLTGWQMNSEDRKRTMLMEKSFTEKKMKMSTFNQQVNARESNKLVNLECIKKYKLSKSQAETYKWLKEQNINTDNATLCYWSKIYPEKRLKEVIHYANARSQKEVIRNIGGWIQKMLKENQILINDSWHTNQKYLAEFLVGKQWSALKVYEKYIKDSVTEDDLSLTMNPEEFRRSLEALYSKSQRYSWTY
jgi:hypothetical protein